MGGSKQQGRALSIVTNGLTLAIIAGVPFGILVGENFGWRATFLCVGGLSAVSLLGILVGLPIQLAGTTASLGKRLALTKRPDIMAILATSALTVAGTFTVYTYLGVFLADVAAIGPRGLALVLFGFGLASAVGTRLGGAAADRLGARPFGYRGRLSHLSGLRHPVNGCCTRACAGHGRSRASHLALGPGQLGSDYSATGATGCAISRSSRGQPIAEFVSRLSR